MTHILHLIDSLQAGGAERAAVNISNALAQKGYIVTLCATRTGGILEAEIGPNVEYICLKRASRVDIRAIIELMKYVKNSKVDIIHAHSTSLFLAGIVKSFFPSVRIIWHDHYGASSITNRPVLLYRSMVKWADGVIAVNRTLADWSKNNLNKDFERVWTIPNFVQIRKVTTEQLLPGNKGCRILCVANLRPQKDHKTLIRAMSMVTKKLNTAHLILVGANNYEKTSNSVFIEIENLGLTKHISFLGTRLDVHNIMANCDIGVLSSLSEGLPITLLEYGAAGLPVVVTDVGDCGEVVDYGNAGILVRPGSPEQLADGILSLLTNVRLRNELGEKLHKRVAENYSQEIIINKLEQVYTTILNSI